VKVGDVVRKERERKKLSLEHVAGELGLAVDQYSELESGNSPTEKWFPLLCNIAVQLETPTSRLLADSGKSADAKDGQAGELIKKHRERRSKTTEAMAQALGLTAEEYAEVEAGTSGIEEHGPRMLRFAEIVELPVFNFFLPCGLPLDKLDVKDYP
jgi:transcriptional regulator with XRE-family HTH domain